MQSSIPSFIDEWDAVLTDYNPSSTLSSATSADVKLCQGMGLKQNVKDQIRSIYWSNMGDLVEPTTLYSDPVEKDLELFHPEQYYLYIASPASSSSASTGKQGNLNAAEELEDDRVLAYVALRKCREDTKESLETGDEASQIDVVYIYELQVLELERGKGLGSKLLMETIKIAEQMKVKKVVLTCLKRNVPSLRFYKKHGFKPDEIDPTYSYRISLFTKLLQRQRKVTAANKAKLLKDVDKDWAEGDVEGKEDADYRILSLKVGSV